MSVGMVQVDLPEHNRFAVAETTQNKKPKEAHL